MKLISIDIPNKLCAKHLHGVYYKLTNLFFNVFDILSFVSSDTNGLLMYLIFLCEFPWIDYVLAFSSCKVFCFDCCL